MGSIFDVYHCVETCCICHVSKGIVINVRLYITASSSTNFGLGAGK